ncbi:general stress protein [Halobacillus aidingensis]|uniref:Uncharacterized protein n=1 Tax=Halobacillus aidingensis TaxID=240303 RepID=A0A1H0ITZ2_HALAD|nr:general stress protein [Halobacillus aidingensis]SDO34917.1 hypothetical protein SAMN05421677_104187 [Halobacillus aidingensis]
MDRRIIGGVFSKVGHAEKAITDLQHHGYGSNDISVFARDKSKVNVLEEEMDTSVTSNKGGRGKNAGKGAGLGALSGGALGGIGGLIAGLGLLAIPGIGQIAAAGPIAAALTGAGVGAGGGGIVGALVGAGMSEKDAHQYENHLKDGKIIVIVEATEKLQDKVYRTFLSNKTENSSMYPNHYQNHDHSTRHESVSRDHDHQSKTDVVKEKSYARHSSKDSTPNSNETRSRTAERHRSTKHT